MKEIKLVQESFQDYLNENNINLFDNNDNFQDIYENKTVIKRKYTETHPAKHAYSEAKIRNAVVEFVNSKSQVTEKQMKTFLKKLSETVGKPISRTWLNASKNLFKLEEDNGEMFYKLSNRGNKIFSKIVAIKEGTIVRLKNMELIREDFEFLNGLLGKVEEVEEEIPEEEIDETPSEETSDDENENGKELLSISVGNKKFVIKLFTEEETEDGEEVSQVTVDDENIEPISDEESDDSEEDSDEEETEEAEDFDSEGTVNLQEEFESLGYVPAQPDLLDGKEIGDNYNKMVNFVPKVISKYCDQDLECPMMWHAEDKKLVAPCSINDTKLLLSSNGNTSDEIKTITICTTDQDGNYITICSDLEGIQPEDLVAIIKKIKGGSFDDEIQQANNVSAQIPEESEKMENEVEENDEDDEPKFESFKTFINEAKLSKEAVIAMLVKRGNNKEEATKMVDVDYDYVVKTYENITVGKAAEIISSLSSTNRNYGRK